ncbi:ribosomal protein L2 [Orientia chuto str. Dubai]|uniref:Large ribosomal subunit protein uL2 n=1 Tax=Orientia chuto str. Dubai TaxID=1359168 RepID=A0A0F3MIH6_9RICK|nr:50S ribosomal protein L2 [Candidatus Orientia mediorientalis]KJV55272.1 ribosomal protein L2 [Orientia chuto str. Dubai]
MPLKIYNAVTSSLRQVVQVDKSELWKGRPLKRLTRGFSKTGGRNNLGRITVWHRGKGHKQLYRMVDFKRKVVDIYATVERIEYDPNRTAFIALIKYDDGRFSYILAPKGLNIGDKIISSKNDAEISVGNCLPLEVIPVGTTIHNIEIKAGKGGQIARSAGAYAVLLNKDSGYALIRLRSGEVRKILLTSRATIGSVSNIDHKNISYGKAGRVRWLGRRPVVRGVAMNPVDHPHGGGEGKTSGGRHPVTPWGKKTKGKKTRKNKFTSKFIVKRKN